MTDPFDDQNDQSDDQMNQLGDLPLVAGSAPATTRRDPPPGGHTAGPIDQRLARRVARAAGSFEHRLLGREPASVTIVATAGWMVVQLHEPFSLTERRLAADADGALEVREFHRGLFERSLAGLLHHVRRVTGVELRGALAHVDPLTGSVLKTLTTQPDVHLFLLGRGLPMLGVPVDAHLYANGTNGRAAPLPPAAIVPGGIRSHEEGDPCWY